MLILKRNSDLIAKKHIPSGRSSVLLGVLTTGNEDLCLPPRLKPVDAVSTSDITPGSSSNRRALFVGG